MGVVSSDLPWMYMLCWSDQQIFIHCLKCSDQNSNPRFSTHVNTTSDNVQIMFKSIQLSNWACYKLLLLKKDWAKLQCFLLQKSKKILSMHILIPMLNKCMCFFNVLNKRTRLIKYNDANIMNNQVAYIQNIYVYIHIQLMSTVYYSTCIIKLDIRDHNKKHSPLELNM